VSGLRVPGFCPTDLGGLGHRGEGQGGCTGAFDAVTPGSVLIKRFDVTDEGHDSSFLNLRSLVPGIRVLVAEPRCGLPDSVARWGDDG
jgi:hypothetical protein